MRLTEFWARMEAAFDPGYARVWADTHVMSALGGRTVSEALAAGDDPKDVWRVVWQDRRLPAHLQ